MSSFITFSREVAGNLQACTRAQCYFSALNEERMTDVRSAAEVTVCV